MQRRRGWVGTSLIVLAVAGACGGRAGGAPAGGIDAGDASGDAGSGDGADTSDSEPVDAADAGACVDIPISAYSTVCGSAEQCTVLPVGQVCSGNCLCGGVPANVSAETVFAHLTAGMKFAVCPCAPPPALECIGKVCTAVAPDAQ
jgi:hypothetical protein